MRRDPIEIHVRLTPSDEVLTLRSQLEASRQECERLQEELRRLEFQFRCETLINLRLQDLCREKGVKIPRALYQRPYVDRSGGAG